jgi:hypothetical protein
MRPTIIETSVVLGVVVLCNDKGVFQLRGQLALNGTNPKGFC